MRPNRLPDGALPSGLRPWARRYLTRAAFDVLVELDELHRDDVALRRARAGVATVLLEAARMDGWLAELSLLEAGGFVASLWRAELGDGAGRLEVGITHAGDRALELARR